MLKIGVLASGRGSNLNALIDYFKKEKLPVDIGLVLSDNPESPAIEIAERSGIKHLCIPEKKHKTFLSGETEKKYVAALIENEIQLVCLAGFMRILKSHFIDTFAGRIVNIHPSLLPAFPGLAAWKQAIDYGVKFTGCTTHFVEYAVDSGPIIMQAVVPVLKDDTPESLHKRIQEKEHFIYPLTIKLIAEGKISISERRVHISA